eukprot:gene41328-65386_t
MGCALPGRPSPTPSNRRHHECLDKNDPVGGGHRPTQRHVQTGPDPQWHGRQRHARAQLAPAKHARAS